MANESIAGDFSDGIVTATDPDVLYGYLDSVDPADPKVAWTQVGNAVDVFMNETDYPYAANTRVGIWVYQNAVNPTAISGSQFADVPESAKLLLKYSILDDMYRNLLHKAVPQKILSGLHAERARLGV